MSLWKKTKANLNLTNHSGGVTLRLCRGATMRRNNKRPKPAVRYLVIHNGDIQSFKWLSKAISKVRHYVKKGQYVICDKEIDGNYRYRKGLPKTKASVTIRLFRNHPEPDYFLNKIIYKPPYPEPFK